MISVAEAERLILEHAGRLPAGRVRVKDAAGRVLRRAILADRDGPPFDRATLDGVCLRHADWAAGRREFPVAGVQAAGSEPVGAPPTGACLEILTGAPVPAPCDCVWPVEDFERFGDLVRARPGIALAPGQGIHPRGSDFKAGEPLVAPGCVLTGREIAVAASCGCEALEVAVRPRIAILTTGDELVDVEDTPRPHQIRRSNDLALRASLAAAGFLETELNHLPDNPQAISWNLERLLQQADVILVTGGASKGRFDHVPATLVELGVREVFHGVAQRPGRPLFFGVFPRPGDFLHPEDTRVVAVFALPGNPVSAFACLHRHVLPALGRMVGREAGPPPERPALESGARAHPALTLFLPVRLVAGSGGGRAARPAPFNTSGDFASVAATDGFVEIPPGERAPEAGERFPFTPWR